MGFALDRDNTLTEIPAAPITLDGTQYPASIFTLWSDAERDALGIYPITDDEIPAGKQAVSSTLERDGTDIRRRWVLEDVPPIPHIITGVEFLALFTPAEVAALWSADPRLMAGALKVAAQDSCNLDSPECAGMLQLAVAKGVLTLDRVPQILAATPPA